MEGPDLLASIGMSCRRHLHRELGPVTASAIDFDPGYGDIGRSAFAKQAADRADGGRGENRFINRRTKHLVAPDPKCLFGRFVQFNDSPVSISADDWVWHRLQNAAFVCLDSQRAFDRRAPVDQVHAQ